MTHKEKIFVNNLVKSIYKDLDAYISTLNHNKTAFCEINSRVKEHLISNEAYVNNLLEYHLPKSNLAEKQYFNKIGQVILNTYFSNWVKLLNKLMESTLSTHNLQEGEVFNSVYFQIEEILEKSVQKLADESNLELDIDYLIISRDIENFLFSEVENSLKNTKSNVLLNSTKYKDLAVTLKLISNIELSNREITPKLSYEFLKNVKKVKLLELPQQAYTLIKDIVSKKVNEEKKFPVDYRDVNYFLDFIEEDDFSVVNDQENFNANFEIIFEKKNYDNVQVKLTNSGNNSLSNSWKTYLNGLTISENNQDIEELKEKDIKEKELKIKTNLNDDVLENKISAYLLKIANNFSFDSDNIEEKTLKLVTLETDETEFKEIIVYQLKTSDMLPKITIYDEEAFSKMGSKLIENSGNPVAKKMEKEILIELRKQTLEYVQTQNTLNTPFKILNDDLKIHYAEYILKFINRTTKNILNKYNKPLKGVYLTDTKFSLDAVSLDRISRFKLCLEMSAVKELIKTSNLNVNITKQKNENGKVYEYIVISSKDVKLFLTPDYILKQTDSGYIIVGEVGSEGVTTAWGNTMKKCLHDNFKKELSPKDLSVLSKLAKVLELSVNRRRKVHVLTVNALLH